MTIDRLKRRAEGLSARIDELEEEVRVLEAEILELKEEVRVAVAAAKAAVGDVGGTMVGRLSDGKGVKVC